jgi:hypothetical protein
LIDVVPTVMSVLGLSPPLDVDGRDLTELLNGKDPPWADRELFLSVRTTGPHSNLVRGVLSGSHKYLRRSRPIVSESLYDIERDPAETRDLASVQADPHRRLAAVLEAYLGEKSSGIHLRIVSDFPRRPVGCEARLHTTGRFVEVSGVRLEAGDRFELSADGRELRLDFRLENRHQSTRAGPRLIPDEDGLIFLVNPPDAPIVVQQLRRADGGAFPLRAGGLRGREAVPFTFEATDASWSVRDVEELLADAAWAPRRASPEAYVGVVRAPSRREEIPNELLDRLRALGYVNDMAEVE